MPLIEDAYNPAKRTYTPTPKPVTPPKPKKKPVAVTPVTSPVTTTTMTPAMPGIMPTYKIGTKNADIANIERTLNTYGAGLKVDSKWDADTMAGYQAYDATMADAASRGVLNSSVPTQTLTKYFSDLAAQRAIAKSRGGSGGSTTTALANKQNAILSYLNSLGPVEAYNTILENKADLSNVFNINTLINQYKKNVPIDAIKDARWFNY